MRTTAIGEKAMLVDLSIRAWFPHITDRKVTDEITDQYHVAGHGMLAARKRLLGKSATDRVTKARNALRTQHYFLTLPWADSGPRILSNTGYMYYRRTIGELQEKFDAAVEDFIAQYPDFIEDAKLRLNGTFNPGDYPTQSKLVDLFGVDIRFLPFPSAADFRVSLTEADVTAIRAQIEADSKATVKAAMKDVWQRLYDVLSHAADRLRIYDVTVNDKGRAKVNNPFRDSLLTNITELLDVVPALNIADDPALVAMSQQIRREIAGHTLEELRDSPAVRSQVADTADSIMSKMAGFIA